MKLILLGAGRMGHAVADVARSRGHDVVALLDRAVLTELDGSGLAARLEGADCAVDFTVAEQVPRSVAAAADAGTPLVIGTTGWAAERARILAPAGEAGIGLVHGPNFSVGVHLFVRIAAEAARLVDRLDDYDVHLHESHHRHKVDHPSGTAVRLADLLVARIGRKERWSAVLEEGRAPDPAVLQVSSVRAGEIPGTHTVAFEGSHDTVELRHTARSRSGFAQGAVLASEWILNRTGIHTFESVLDEILDAG